MPRNGEGISYRVLASALATIVGFLLVLAWQDMRTDVKDLKDRMSRIELAIAGGLSGSQKGQYPPMQETLDQILEKLDSNNKPKLGIQKGGN